MVPVGLLTEHTVSFKRPKHHIGWNQVHSTDIKNKETLSKHVMQLYVPTI